MMMTQIRIVFFTMHKYLTNLSKSMLLELSYNFSKEKDSDWEKSENRQVELKQQFLLV